MSDRIARALLGTQKPAHAVQLGTLRAHSSAKNVTWRELWRIEEGSCNVQEA